MSQLSSSCVGGRLSRRPGVSEDSDRLAQQWVESQQHYRAPVSQQPVLVGERFESLAAKWRDATQYMSSVTQMISRPEYLQIIGMGEAVLPYILRELERDSDHWGPALSAITNTDPVREEDWGDLTAIRARWLGWAREHGVRW
jgi:hypothetical protein